LLIIYIMSFSCLTRESIEKRNYNNLIDPRVKPEGDNLEIIMKPDYWARAKKELSKRDPVMKKLIAGYAGEGLARRGDNAFETLARAITGQQISVKAADTIWNRLVTKYNPLLPESLLHADDTELRALGFSRQKVGYIKDIADKFFYKLIAVSHHETGDKDDAEIMRELMSIKGVGRWTAEMFMIFHLLKPDIFPIGDLGLQKTIQNLYFKSKKTPPARMEKVAEKWRPWRTVATWYLWRSLDPYPISY